MPNPVADAPQPTDPCVVLPERRHSARLPCPELPAVRYLLRPSLEQGVAALLDFSADGVGLLLHCKPEPGATLFIRFLSARRGEDHTRLARIAHVTPLTEDTWLVGCQFTEPLGGPELNRLRQLFAAAPD